MANKYPLLFTVLFLAVVVVSFLHARHHNQTFQDFLMNIGYEAQQQGIAKPTVEKYLLSAKRLQRTVRREHHQPQKRLTFSEYSKRFTSESRVKRANKEYNKHKTLLKNVGNKYGVDPRYIVAIWGIESAYGTDIGHTSLMSALTTLAHGDHRPEFFRQQLLDALKILNRPKVIPEQLKSSYDGGMGQSQFMPSAYLVYAVDYDGDGFIDIWTNEADVFASIANYLKKDGWKTGEPSSIQVTVPDTIKQDDIGIKNMRDMQYWKQKGVKAKHDVPLPDLKAALLMPDGKDGQAFLVFENFKVLLRWNNIHFEALSIGLLTDKITP